MIEREFRVGDKVTCNILGIGVIIKVEIDSVMVEFINKRKAIYNNDGTYCGSFKRTLFILPQTKPTKQQVKEKFKQLLDKAEEVEFSFDKKNYFVELFYEYNNVYFCYTSYNTSSEFFNTKYITSSDAERIVEEMNKFINGENNVLEM